MWLPVLLNLFALWLITILRKPKVKACKLDVLVGHPEHDLLFVATKMARGAALKKPAS